MFDDLMQEVTCHLHQIQSEEPGQTPSYYLQSCLRFLRDILRLGTSLDSYKRAGARLALPDEASDELVPECLMQPETTRSAANANDVLGQLFKVLDSRDQTILDLRLQGWGVAEIAKHLRVSHQYISQRRQAIAVQANALGFSYSLKKPEEL